MIDPPFIRLCSSQTNLCSDNIDLAHRQVVLRDNFMEELDYFLLPESAWNSLTLWYGLTRNSRAIARRVVEYGMYTKHIKVEVYLLECSS